ncbi:nSTAND1 domain-containing NTPase [Streptomyces sp. NPDC002845]
MAGRREVPVDPGAGPVQRFASELRKLRADAGGITYRAMAQRAGYSITALSKAAAGEQLPTLPVVLAYAAACGGDAAQWEARWKQAVEEAAATPGTGEDGGGEGADPPYRGLARFETGDSNLFFGRDRLTADLLDLLRRRRFAAVFGPSGSGKSSLLRAGLVPALQQSRETSLRPGVIRILTPGDQPARAHAHLLDADGPANGSGGDGFVIVDQFEEVYTLCHDVAERTRFIDLLLAARQPASRLRVLIAVRADFYGRCAEHHGLADALRDANLLVSPMSQAELREAIVKPATATGLTVERALTARIVQDVADESGGLPLMSHALLETWRRRRGRALTETAYDAVGGVLGAIARTAEHLYTQLSPEQAALARDLLLRLITPGEGAQDTRRPAPRAELASSAHGDAALVLERLARARLVTLDDDTVDLAHEALITAWPRLRTWIETDRELLRTHRRLTQAAAEWEQHGRDESFLYRGARLASWDEHALERLNDTERAFLTACRARRAQESAKHRRRMWTGAVALATAVAVVGALGGATLVQAERTATERSRATSRQLAAEARSALTADPRQARLLARRAYTAAPTAEAEAVLRQAVADDRLITVLPGNRGRALGVTFSPDGRQLADTSEDGTIRVWQWANGRIVGSTPRVLRGHEGEAWSPAFSPDGRYLATAGLDGTVRVWAVGGTAKPLVLHGHKGPVWTVAFSPDGRQIASAGDDGTVRIWDARGEGTPAILRGHEGAAVGVAFDPQGRRLASSGHDGTVRIWKPAGRGVPTVLRGHGDDTKTVAFSPDGTRLISASTDGTARVWDTGGKVAPVVLRGHSGTVEGAAFSPDGQLVATASDDATIRVWNPSGGANPLVLRGHGGVVWAASFSPDGHSLATASSDGTVRIWDPRGPGDPVVLRGHKGAAWTVDASGPGGRPVVSGGQDGTVRIWDPARRRAVRVLRGHDGEVLGLVVSQDGRRAASAGADGTVRIWDLTGGTEPVAVLNGHEDGAWSVALSSDGQRVASIDGDATLRVWHLTEGHRPAFVRPSADGTVLRSVAFSPDGQQVATGGHEKTHGTVRIWDTHNGRTLRVLRGHRGLVWTVAFSPDGNHLASGADDGTVRIWDLTRDRDPLILRGNQGFVWNVAFGPDGDWVASAGKDGTVRLWRNHTGGEPLTFEDFGTSVEDITFLADSRDIATSHGDGTVRLWHCDACGPIRELLAPEGSQGD